MYFLKNAHNDINPIQTGLFEFFIVQGEGRIWGWGEFRGGFDPPPRISENKNQFHLKLSSILDQYISKIFLPKWLKMTS